MAGSHSGPATGQAFCPVSFPDFLHSLPLPMTNRSTLLLAAAFGATLALSSCDTAKQRETGAQVRAEQVNPRVSASISNLEAMEKNGMLVTPYIAARAMNETQLRVREPQGGSLVEPGDVKFLCEVSNFRLGSPPTVPEAGLTMSTIGQSITTIIDNETATEHATPSFSKSLAAGHHTILTFLTRATRESLKNRFAYDLRTLRVGSGPATGAPFNLKAPAIFYSLPRGTYTGDEADKILLDFYVVNATLEEEGTSVRLTVNGTPFTLGRWAAYTLEGLPMGPNKIQLELIDADGHVIPGPYNSVMRTITLRPDA